MALVAIIPARGGSKGIPRKNILTIAGKPLIAWTIEAALQSRQVDRVVVSTEDSEIAELSRSFGADVPFIRPAELATDETPGIDPVLHALHMLPGYDEIVLLQPTSPLRTAADIDAAIALKRSTLAPTVVSVTMAECHPLWMFTLGHHGEISPVLPTEPPARRQDLPPVYVLNGAIYVADRKRLLETKVFRDLATKAYVMPLERSVDIDTPLDWLLAEVLLAGAVSRLFNGAKTP